jgi:hypothetical protein
MLAGVEQAIGEHIDGSRLEKRTPRAAAGSVGGKARAAKLSVEKRKEIAPESRYSSLGLRVTPAMEAGISTHVWTIEGNVRDVRDAARGCVGAS